MNIKDLILGATIGVSSFTFLSAEDPSSITLKSPNGNNVITLSAMDDGAGIWISRKNDTDLVGIYNGFNQGAVVGVGDPSKHGGYPVALSGEGRIQILKK